MSAYPQRPSFPIDVRDGRFIKVRRVGGTAVQIDLDGEDALVAPGTAIGNELAAKANAADLGTAAALQTTQISGDNLWFNPDCALGNGSEQVLPNTALNVFGPDRWTFQQTGLNPFETVSRVTMPEGDTALFWMNGINATGANTFGVGIKTLNTTISDLNFVDGFDVEMVDRDDISKKMFCKVVSYSGNTLVLNATSVSAGASGSRTYWVVGRNGNTNKGITTAITNAPTPPGSDILRFADTSGIEIGATIEYVYGAQFEPIAGIQLGAYVVSKTPTTVRMSKPAVAPAGAPPGVAVVNPQTVRFYGNQGHYGYQDASIDDIKSLRYGTPLARKSYFEFDVVSNVGGLRASVMFLGYKPAPPFIGRALTQSFDITTTRTRVSLPIPGDTEHPDDTWIGEGLNGSWGTLGFALDSKGTPTSLNIPDGAWMTAPGEGLGVGGSDRQTFQLGDMVGAWVKITSVKWGLDRSSAYEAPTTLAGQYPSPIKRIRDRKLPRLIWENLAAAFNKRKWQARVLPDGTLGFGKLTDAEDGEIPALVLNPDGSVSLPQYPAGDAVVSAGGILGSVPFPFTAYTPGVVAASPGATPPTFGPVTGRFRISGKTVFVQVSIPVTNVGTASGALVVDLPIAPTGREWFLLGSDSSAGTGKALFGRIPAGVPAIQVRGVDGTFPAVNGSTLNLSGFYETP